MISSHSPNGKGGLVRRLILVLFGLAVVGAAIGAWLHLSRGATVKVNATDALLRSEAALKAHDATSARDLAMAAVRAAPSEAAPHLALAKSMLALDDGIGAEVELKRARDAGANAKLLRHLRAHAYLLQGDTAKALNEAGGVVDPAYRSYALRISGRALRERGDWTAAAGLFNQAIQLAPHDPETWFEVARFRQAAGDGFGANVAARRVLQLDPGHLGGLVFRGELVRAQYGLVAALPWFEAALHRDPRDHDALIEYAATLGDAGRSLDALAATRQAITIRPGSAQALYLQAVIAARAGNAELASTLLARTKGTMDALPGMLLLKGILDLQSGEYEQAITRLKALLDQQPRNIAGRKLLASTLLLRDAASEALRILDPLDVQGSADSYTLLLTARARERTGDRAGAAALIDRSVALRSSQLEAAFGVEDSLGTLAAQADQDPNNPAALVTYMQGLYAAGDVGAGLNKAEQVASRIPEIPAVQLLLGDASMLADRPADAVVAFRRAADMRFDITTLLRLVEALDRSGKRGEAANALSLFLSQNPMSMPALRLSARSQLVAGQYDAAINSLEQLRAQLGDGDAAINADLALAYAGAGSLNIAQEFGEAAYALAPANPLVVEAFGWVLYKAGDFPRAAELTRKGLQLVPGSPELRWQLAQIYAEAGNRREAAALLEGLLADTRFFRRVEASSLLARLR